MTSQQIERSISKFANHYNVSGRKKVAVDLGTYFIDVDIDQLPNKPNKLKYLLSSNLSNTSELQYIIQIILNIGIATQKVTMLDTQIMGNLHTYFVSRLPRKYDRSTIAEAFGIEEEELSPTFTFKAGNWLILSHDATGLKGVPIPTTAFNANERIKKAEKES